MDTFDSAKGFMEAIVFTETPWPILSDDTYSMEKKYKNLPSKLGIISGY